MGEGKLSKDPYNMIITGVGGQGNVMASRVLGNMLVRSGYHVTIGETFGASQRGGSVMSHLRISEKSSWSPQMPKGKAHMIVALEPTEAVRLLPTYGNRSVKILSNTRPVHPVSVIAAEQEYPSLGEIIESVKELSSEAWFIDATDEAMKLGNPILGNIIMLGALAETDTVPMEKEDFIETISMSMPKSKRDLNLKAYDLGAELLRSI